MQGKRYLDYSSFVRKTWGERVQKIAVNIGFSCPNRDGSKGYGGCTYCNNDSFNPDYCEPENSITTQLQEGIQRFSAKYKSQQYLAYFQAYTNTYTHLDNLKAMYEEALAVPGVIGLVIGTRPDCISQEIIDYLGGLAQNYNVSLEFGIESTLDKTLKAVNRCHSYQDTIDAYQMAIGKGLHLGGHIILGLPGESREELLSHADRLSKLPIDSLKIHHLQIIKQSIMAFQYRKNPEGFSLFEPEVYIDLIVEFLENLRPDLVIERFISEAPKNLLIAPNWGLKNFEIVNRIDKEMTRRNTWQGRLYQIS
ncbi:MAG: TIGR01212 family radical SAM protein [Flavobacteriaceae bacterium]